MAEKIKAILMIEILGKPADYVKQFLSDLIDKLGKEEHVKVINKNIADPKIVEKEIFSSFAEVEIETDLDALMMVIFAYMPSHIDIIQPENLRIKNSELNLFFNELARKLHQYDEIAKALTIERGYMAQQIEELKRKAGISEEKQEVSEDKKEKEEKREVKSEKKEVKKRKKKEK